MADFNDVFIKVLKDGFFSINTEESNLKNSQDTIKIIKNEFEKFKKKNENLPWFAAYVEGKNITVKFDGDFIIIERVGI